MRKPAEDEGRGSSLCLYNTCLYKQVVCAEHLLSSWESASQVCAGKREPDYQPPVETSDTEYR